MFNVVFLNSGICATAYLCARVVNVFAFLSLSSSHLLWFRSGPLITVETVVLGLGELSCLVKGCTERGICLILGLVGHEDCLILGVFGETEVFRIRGDVGPGLRGVGEVGSVLGMKMTEAKLSSESTLVSLWRLLSFEESEPSSLE